MLSVTILTIKTINRFNFVALVILLSLSPQAVLAQTPTPPEGPIYIVQTGDTLWDIATLFGTSIDDIVAANNLPSSDLYVGDSLIIPGLGIQTGALKIRTILFGETLRNLVRESQADETTIRNLNRIVSPSELYVGYRLIFLQENEQSPSVARTSIGPFETSLEFAVTRGVNPWTIPNFNALTSPWEIFPGDILYYPSAVESVSAGAPGLPPIFSSLEIDPLPLKQGDTAQISATLNSEIIQLSGVLIDKPLRFFRYNNSWVALQGVHAMVNPGIYPIRIEAALVDGSVQPFEQMIRVESGYYPTDPTLIVNQQTIDPAVMEPEADLIQQFVNVSTSERYWQGTFQSPAYFPDCFTSRYGSRRTYQTPDLSLSYSSFHSGVDFCGGVGLPISAPAPGYVVFADLLQVRGYATIIDHGWGVFSGFWHQSELQVSVGDWVETGQIIGLVGGTGRVTGAHLHWEIWVNGVQTNPIDWLDTTYPYE